ncbi:hypothetical protein GE061_006876 [Apolygus lucorum]|uniref:Uncharacterized protein n=1 Tax=Apolygus lucorum TaxID=248454 RepID=A0A6A4J995_APOLU|nr:hypothetical protein GE061_006876 [Apolygus lucorum]
MKPANNLLKDYSLTRLTIPPVSPPLHNEILLRPNEIPLRPNEIPLRPNEIPFRPNEIPLRPNEIPPRPNEIPLRPNEIPLRPNEIPFRPNEIPLCPKEIPLRPNEIPPRPNEIPLRPNEIPLRPNEIPFRPKEIPLCPKEIPLRPNEIPLRPNEIPFRPNEIPLRPNEILPALPLQLLCPIQVPLSHSVETFLMDVLILGHFPVYSPSTSSSSFCLLRSVEVCNGADRLNLQSITIWKLYLSELDSYSAPHDPPSLFQYLKRDVSTRDVPTRSGRCSLESSFTVPARSRSAVDFKITPRRLHWGNDDLLGDLQNPFNLRLISYETCDFAK